MQANDTLDAGPPLILDILGAVPADGIGVHRHVRRRDRQLDSESGRGQPRGHADGGAGAVGGRHAAHLHDHRDQRRPRRRDAGHADSGRAGRRHRDDHVDDAGQRARSGRADGAARSATCRPARWRWREVSFIPATTGTLFTTASVSSQTPDSVIANNFHTIAASIVPAGQGVSLSLTKTDSIDPVAVDAPFTYTLTATNAGTTVATNVVVTDHVPAGITITYATSASGMCSAISSQVLCSFASLTPGESVTMTFNATATAAGVVTNQAVGHLGRGRADAGRQRRVASRRWSWRRAAAARRRSRVRSLFSATAADRRRARSAISTATASRTSSRRSRPPTRSRCLLGNGTGCFGAPTLFPSGLGTHEGVILDLNGDGRLDLALEGSPDAFVLFGNGSGGFGAPIDVQLRARRSSPTCAPPTSTATAGRTSRSRRSGPNAAAHPAQQRQRRLRRYRHRSRCPAAADRIAIQDLNGDERPDLALSYIPTPAGGATNLDLRAARQRRRRIRGADRLRRCRRRRSPASSHSGDINGDSRRDLAVIEILPTGRRCCCCFGDGAGGFTTQELTSTLPGRSA